MLLLHGPASLHPGLQRKFGKEMPLMSLGVHGKCSCLASWEVGLIEQLTGSTSKQCFWYIREKHVKYTLGAFLPKQGCFCLFGTNFATWSESDWRNQKSGVPQHCSFIPQPHLKVTFPVFRWRTKRKKYHCLILSPKMLYLQLLHPFVTVICLNRNSGVLVHCTWKLTFNTVVSFGSEHLLCKVLALDECLVSFLGWQ